MITIAQAAGDVVTTGEAVTFWILGPIALAGALGMVFARNAVHSALMLASTMLSLAVRQHHGAERGGDEERARDLEREHVPREDDVCEAGRVAVGVGGAQTLVRDVDDRVTDARDEQDRKADTEHEGRHSAAADAEAGRTEVDVPGPPGTAERTTTRGQMARVSRRRKDRA